MSRDTRGSSPASSDRALVITLYLHWACGLDLRPRGHANAQRCPTHIHFLLSLSGVPLRLGIVEGPPKATSAGSMCIFTKVLTKIFTKILTQIIANVLANFRRKGARYCLALSELPSLYSWTTIRQFRGSRATTRQVWTRPNPMKTLSEPQQCV